MALTLFDCGHGWRSSINCVFTVFMQVGAYVPGSDPQLDEAIALQPAMTGFLQQSMFESSSMEQSLAGMAQAMQRG